MSKWQKFRGALVFAANKVKWVFSQINPAVKKVAGIAEFVAEMVDDGGDWLAAVEPADIPFLYGPLATAIVEAQGVGAIVGLAGGEKYLAVQKSLQAAQIGVKGADEVYDRRWAAGQPFLEAFIERAKHYKQFGFKPSGV